MASPTPDRPRGSPALAPTDWLLTIAGVLLVGYGGYLVVQQGLAGGGWTHRTGIVIASFGLILTPFAVLRLLGGIGLIAVGVWLFINRLGGFDLVYSIVLVLIGASAAIEGARRARHWASGTGH